MPEVESTMTSCKFLHVSKLCMHEHEELLICLGCGGCGSTPRSPNNRATPQERD